MFSILAGLLSLCMMVEANIQGRICTNQSYYSQVDFQETGSVCCSTVVGEPVCTTRQEEACVNVTEIKCDVSMTQQCENEPCPVKTVFTDALPKTYISKKCEERKLLVPHTKVKKVPKIVTKQICQTIWKTNADGGKEWDKDECEEVEWEEFQDEEYEAVLETTEMVCVDGEQIRYNDCGVIEVDTNQQCLICKAVAKPVCSPQQKQKCNVVDITTCEPQVTDPICDNEPPKMPYQEFVHKEKCLFDDAGALNGSQEGRHHHNHA